MMAAVDLHGVKSKIQTANNHSRLAIGHGNEKKDSGINAMPAFIECLSCSEKWFSRDKFLADLDIEIIGYQVNVDDLLAGIFLFSHSCGATLSLSVRHFNNLYEGPIFKERVTGSDDCPAYCLYQDQLDNCSARCECAYVRHIIDIIKKWPKMV